MGCGTAIASEHDWYITTLGHHRGLCRARPCGRGQWGPDSALDARAALVWHGRRSLLPRALATLSRRQVPVRATLVAGVLVLLSTVAFPFHALLRLSTTLTLVVFALVS